MLRVTNLVVNYGYISALKGISLEIKPREIVSLIGANGAGKTSTLMAISGLVDKAEGSVIFNGEDITNTRSDLIVHKGLAHVPEGRHVFPKLSVSDNLISGSIAAGKMSKAELNQLLEEQYELFPRLKERRTQAAGTLSGGEQQMLAISRAMMGKPKLLMLDEPSLGLAPIIVEEIFDLITRIRDAGITVLLIEQNASMALQVSDHAYTLELGSVVISGTGEELLQSNEVRKAYLGM